MRHMPNPWEETLQSILEEGNFIAPRPDLEEDFASNEKKAVILLLWGIAFCMVLPLIYFRFALLPLAGSILLLWGTLRLRKVNKWLGVSFVMSVLQIVWRLALLICDSIPNTELLTIPFIIITGHIVSVLAFAQLICIDRGIHTALHATGTAAYRPIALGMLSCYAILVGLRFAPDILFVMIFRICAGILCAWLLHRITSYFE